MRARTASALARSGQGSRARSAAAVRLPLARSPPPRNGGRRLHAPPRAFVLRLRPRELLGALEEERRGSERPAHSRVLGCPLECAGNVLGRLEAAAASCHARASGSSSSLASRAWTSRRRSISAVSYAPAASSGCVKRILSPSSWTIPVSIAGVSPWSLGTSDAASVTAIVGCACAAAARKVSTRGRGARRRSCTRRDRDSDIGSRCPGPAAARLRQRRTSAAASERSRARRTGSPGRLVDPGEQRPRERDAEVVVHHLVQRGDVQGGDVDGRHPPRCEGSAQLGDETRLRRCAPRHQHTERSDRSRLGL